MAINSAHVNIILIADSKKKLLKSAEEPPPDDKKAKDDDAKKDKQTEPADSDHAEKGDGGLGSNSKSGGGKNDTNQMSDSDNDEKPKILEPRKDLPEDKIKEDKAEKKGPAPLDIGKDVKLEKAPEVPQPHKNVLLVDKSANFHPLPKMDKSSTKVLTSPEERKRFLGMYQAALGRGSSRFKDILDEIR